MVKNSSQTKGRNRAFSTLEVLIKILALAKDACGIPPAQAAFASVGTLLTIIRVYVSPHPPITSV